MKIKRLENESELDWNMRQIDYNLKEAGRYMDMTVWIWKWLLIPMWSLILIMWVIKFAMHK
jgi:hypothetical protein